jgi:hypothetical protein
MRSIKNGLDERWLLHPGVILPEQWRAKLYICIVRGC